MKYLFKIFIVCFITLVFGCARKVPFLILSEKIESFGKKRNKYKIDARFKLYQTDSAYFLHEKIDTLFILEGHNFETASYYGLIWDKKNKISYNYFLKNLQPVQERVSDYQIKLITNWDTTNIRKEEKINGNWFDNYTLMTGYRCVRQGNDWQIDKIYFKDFFDPKRDK